MIKLCFKKDEDILISARVGQLVSIHFPTELSVDILRNLSTSFYFAMMKPKNKDLVISGYTLDLLFLAIRLKWIKPLLQTLYQWVIANKKSIPY